MRFYTALLLLVTLLVIGLGAYTRLEDAGLGCPDWPGCYGQWRVEPTQAYAEKARAQYHATVEVHKAEVEMRHRYIAGSLGLGIFGLFLASLWRARHLRVLAGGLVLLVGLQAAFGRWTVTLKLLPAVVSGHLFLGVMTFIGLLAFSLRLWGCPQGVGKSADRQWLGFFIGLLVIQLLLGAWTSATYASLACTDFPGCREGAFWPAWDFRSAFNVFTGQGETHPLLWLTDAGRQTLHTVHRTMAVVLLGIAAYLGHRLRGYKHLRSTLLVWFGVLLVQLGLGVSNVIFGLPLAVAVGHTLGATLLLACSYALWFQLGKPAHA